MTVFLIAQTFLSFSWERPWPAVVIDGHIGEIGLGDQQDLVAFLLPFGKGLDLDGERGVAHARDGCIAADQVADKHWLFELEGINRDGDSAAVGTAACNDAAGNINL